MLQKSPFRLRLRWRVLFQPWQETDGFLFALIIGLTVFGGVMIRSAELTLGLTDWRQHWITGSVGLGVALLLARWRYDYLLRWKWLVYGITNFGLIMVMLIGSEGRLGAQRWISIGGFNLQPSEFAKVGLIVTLAAILHETPATKLSIMFKVLGITAIPWLFVFLEPNLGTSLVFGAITMGMLYWGNANPGWLILLVSPVVSAILNTIHFPSWVAWVALTAVIGWRTLPVRFPILAGIGAGLVNALMGWLGHILWGLLKDYQKERLTSFLNPEKDPLGAGYHLIQSRIAIGAGQLTGQGLNQGTQTQLNFIPEQHTDFIFSAVGEELGFIGCIALLIAFWLVCLRLIAIAQSAKDDFGSLIAVGVLSMIVFQVVVNIGMNIGLAPVTGIPLPWISYARSSLLANFIAIGLVQSVANHRHRLRF